MPSVTDYFGETVTNFGPLTTTFTAPASCATETGHYFYGNGSSPKMIYGQPTCGWKTYGDCLPSGAEYDAIASTIHDHPTNGYLYYFSPGYICPAGWTTAGTLSVAGTTVTDEHDQQGVFTHDPTPYHPTEVAVAGIPIGQQWHDVLDDDETLVYCCPSGYEAGINGGCYSSVGPYSAFPFTEYCEVYYPTGALVKVTTYKGTSLDYPLLSVTDNTHPFETSTGPLPTGTHLTEYYENLAIVSFIPALALVHKITDKVVVVESEAPSRNRGVSLLPVLMVVLSVLAGVGLVAPW